MIFAALSEAAAAGELLLVEGGLCRFHLRRDGTVTIREIVVLPDLRRSGIGRAMVAEVRRRHPDSPLEARCPIGYESNAFWPAVGFRLRWTLAGKQVNVWRLDPS